MEDVGTGLTRALYSTYISYLPKEKFSYPIISKKDFRGNFVEVLKTQNSGQFSFSQLYLVLQEEVIIIILKLKSF
jgi:UDP-2-acetamido-2,6-beta-L-arabino-hexul-4-ose reductase